MLNETYAVVHGWVIIGRLFLFLYTSRMTFLFCHGSIIDNVYLLISCHVWNVKEYKPCIWNACGVFTLDVTFKVWVFKTFSGIFSIIVCKITQGLWRWSMMSSYHSPQFKYMKFHIFTCILHHLRVYYELTMWPAPKWLDSSVGRTVGEFSKVVQTPDYVSGVQNCLKLIQQK